MKKLKVNLVLNDVDVDLYDEEAVKQLISDHVQDMDWDELQEQLYLSGEDEDEFDDEYDLN